MDHWDEVARSTKKRSASWYDWCSRHGFDEYSFTDDPHGRMFWSREHFKRALVAMPAQHPDRWKYEVGARYAPLYYAAGVDDPREFWRTFAPIFLLVMVPILLTPVIGPPVWIIPVAFGVYELVHYVKRYRILSS